eukprot:TRINITY_DN19535_c0_g1_i1.p1 TRINITY_DN19535_c0_g1~~TRINITY_DN19535_c0_g1_i1.p1  ORF type:complete len:580 (-),score=119.33 TRINITY_DN19535_c0_g1_i1:148-1887(-)
MSLFARDCIDETSSARRRMSYGQFGGSYESTSGETCSFSWERSFDQHSFSTEPSWWRLQGHTDRSLEELAQVLQDMAPVRAARARQDSIIDSIFWDLNAAVRSERGDSRNSGDWNRHSVTLRADQGDCEGDGNLAWNWHDRDEPADFERGLDASALRDWRAPDFHNLEFDGSALRDLRASGDPADFDGLEFDGPARRDWRTSESSGGSSGSGDAPDLRNGDVSRSLSQCWNDSNSPLNRLVENVANVEAQREERRLRQEGFLMELEATVGRPRVASEASIGGSSTREVSVHSDDASQPSQFREEQRARARSRDRSEVLAMFSSYLEGVSVQRQESIQRREELSRQLDDRLNELDERITHWHAEQQWEDEGMFDTGAGPPGELSSSRDFGNELGHIDVRDPEDYFNETGWSGADAEEGPSEVAGSSDTQSVAGSDTSVDLEQYSSARTDAFARLAEYVADAERHREMAQEQRQQRLSQLNIALDHYSALFEPELAEAPQGCDAEFIELHAPASVWHGSSKDVQCVICVDEIVEGDDVRTFLCQHTYHKQCVDMWLRRSRVCCVCRHPIDEHTVRDEGLSR